MTNNSIKVGQIERKTQDRVVQFFQVDQVKILYDINKEVYRLLRYGVKEGVGEITRKKPQRTICSVHGQVYTPMENL